jgi:hypothetical protein
METGLGVHPLLNLCALELAHGTSRKLVFHDLDLEKATLRALKPSGHNLTLLQSHASP